MNERRLFTGFGAALGVLLSWAVVILLGYAAPDLYSVRVFAATACVGALFGLVVGMRAVRRPTRPPKNPQLATVRRFLKFAAAGWLGHVLVVATIGVVTRREFALHDWSVFVFLAVFGAIGIVVGLIWSRYRTLAVERESAIRLAETRQRAAEELELARQLQQQLLPAPALDADEFTIRARILPARYVAGDFYDYAVSPRQVRFCVADVAGKGAAAGLLMATTKAMLAMVDPQTDPAAALTRLNEELCGKLAARQFVALMYGLFWPDSGRVVLANAGLPDPLQLTRAGSVTAVEATGERLPLGLRKHGGYRSVETTLAPGDRLACFSDGLPESHLGPDDLLGYEDLQTLFAGAARLSDNELLDAVFARVQNGGPTELADDCTLLLLSRHSQA